MIAIDCPSCGQNLGFYGQNEPDDVPSETDWTGCEVCLERIPPSLIKACGDPFDYALKLRTGEIIFFESASIHGKFATLKIVDDPSTGQRTTPMPFPRGLDVRLSDIVWCADAPYGS